MTTRLKSKVNFFTAQMLVCAVFFCACHNDVRPEGGVYLHAKTYQTPKGWGYDILADDKVYIHQPMVPGRAGNAAFVSESDARAVAQLVIHRISSGALPITTTRDLDSLGIK